MTTSTKESAVERALSDLRSSIRGDAYLGNDEECRLIDLICAAQPATPAASGVTDEEVNAAYHAFQRASGCNARYRVRMALEAALAFTRGGQGTGKPEDCVTVPREPTPAMLRAAFDQANADLLSPLGNTECETDEERSAHSIRPIWAAMLAAASTPPSNPSAREALAARASAIEECARIAETKHGSPSWDHGHQIAEQYGAQVAADIRALSPAPVPAASAHPEEA